MRYVASSLLLAWFTVGASGLLTAESPVVPDSSVGKLPAAALSPTPASQITVQTVQDPSQGVSEETPNQRRRRLGLPIEASFPAPEYGEAIETPNHMRKRLGLPMPGEGEQGVAEETPNQMRARMQAQAPTTTPTE